MCSNCLETTLSEGRRTCPVDRGFLGIAKPARNLELNAVIQKLTIRCPNGSGCSWTALGNLNQHKGECAMEMVKCSNTDCAAVVYQYDMAAYQDKCPHKTVRCTNCEGKRKFIEATKHQTNCPKMAIVCPKNRSETLLRYYSVL